MRSVRRGEAAYLELMREAKAQFDAEIAKNKEKGKAGRPRKEVAPVVPDDDDIEIDFSDVVPAEVAAEIIAPAPAPAPEKKSPQKAVAQKPVSQKPVSQKPAVREVKKPAAKKSPAKQGVKKAATKTASAKKPNAARKTVGKKPSPATAKRGKA